MSANQFVTLAELRLSAERSLVLACLEVEALSMFIMGQYNWERWEFDNHG